MGSLRCQRLSLKNVVQGHDTVLSDSSALIKRYIVEPGTTWMRSIIQRSSGNTIIIAQTTQIEIVSGASRRVREGTLTTRTARAVRRLIDRHARRAYVVIGLTPQVVRRAEDLLIVHPLRTYDAVQLASALESNTRLVASGCRLCSLFRLTYACS